MHCDISEHIVHFSYVHRTYNQHTYFVSPEFSKLMCSPWWLDGVPLKAKAHASETQHSPIIKRREFPVAQPDPQTAWQSWQRGGSWRSVITLRGRGGRVGWGSKARSPLECSSGRMRGLRVRERERERACMHVHIVSKKKGEEKREKQNSVCMCGWVCNWIYFQLCW